MVGLASGTFRPARADERQVLDEMTLAGIRHWGHHINYPEAYDALAGSLSDNEFLDDTHIVFVLVEEEEIVAFYELVDHDDHVELLRMFMKPELIGSGYGRTLWDHSTASASELADRMLIVADPGAISFYEAMGATTETTFEVAPGFHLAKMWFPLS